MTLSSARIRLRRWRVEDRDTFAAVNSAARVMEFFRSRLSRAESDAMVDRIEDAAVQHLETAVLSPYIDTIDRWPDNWAASRRH